MSKERNYHSKLHRIYFRLRNTKIPARVVFIAMGVISTAWFLVRVIPKPSRATYPCMKAAFPIMTTFVLWLLSFTGAFIAFKGAGRLFRRARYLTAAVVMVAGLLFSVVWINTGAERVAARNAAVAASVVHPSNEPMGTGVGIHPARVVWVWDQDATDETCDNSQGNEYYLPKHNDQDVIDKMVEDAIIGLAGETTASAAWEAIFKDFNSRKGKGEVNYVAGEKVFIKINEGTSDWLSTSNLTRDYGSWRGNYDAVTETTPATTLAVLKQLIDVVGISQEDICVADPKAHVWQHTYDLIKAEYPDVVIGDKSSGNTSLGRETLTPVTFASLEFSDGGDVVAATDEKHYLELTEADYLINLAALKAHARAGITLTAKNHFGSHTRESAAHMHPGLVAPENDIVQRPDYGVYRVQVDLMGSSVLGLNTLLFLVDGLWGGTEAVDPPVKWTMDPFNNDWPNSIFVSQDQVALESVCFDFLRNEAEVGASEWMDRPNFAQGVDDYLHQAADSENWPEGITYDPDDSGTPIGSLGIHEHWNNPTQKQYKKNMGSSYGIELYAIPSNLVDDTQVGFSESFAQTEDMVRVYPNPVTDFMTVSIDLPSSTIVDLQLLDLSGRVVKQLFYGEVYPGTVNRNFDLRDLNEGIYLYRASFEAEGAREVSSGKIQVLR